MLFHSTLTTNSSSSSFSSTLSQTLLLIELNKMVKFSKQFEGQLIPEWKHAFVDYWQLKKDLKKLYLLKNDNNPDIAGTGTGIGPVAVATAASTLLSSMKKFCIFDHKSRDHGPIHVLFCQIFHFYHFGFFVCVIM